MENRRSVRLTGIAGLVAALTSLAACVADQPRQIRTASVAVPRVATYQCSPQDALIVEINGSTAHVTGPDELDVTLTASPPGQQIRFTDPLNALVVEGREAMLMANRKAPLTCRR